MLYAVDDAHSLPATWIAMRNASVSTLFGFAAILCYDRGREGGKARAAVAAPILYALGLLGGETAVATRSATSRRTPCSSTRRHAARRAAALAPYVAVFDAAVWVAVYKRASRYRSVGSGMYVDPGKEPIAFLLAVVTRLPALLAARSSPGPPAWRIWRWG